MPKSDPIQKAGEYQITVQGNLDSRWSNWFNCLRISYQDETQITTLTGPVADQAELRGILNNIWDLNKTIISVQKLQDTLSQRGVSHDS